MADIYSSFSELAASEPGSAYNINVHDRGTAVAVIAPHGGGIEPGTSEVAAAIAGEEYSLYIFEGMKDRAGRLHITSTRFDEPLCVSMLKEVRLAITVHGEASATERVYIGGAHEKAIDTIRVALESSGFEVREHSKVSLRGRDPRNICNRGACGAGVQLELSRGLRCVLFESLKRRGRQRPTARLGELTGAVRRVLPDIGL